MKRLKTIHFLMVNPDSTTDPRQTQRIELPRTITLGGIEYSINDTPELNNLLNLVRRDTSTVEKAKLYNHIEQMKQKMEVLQNAQIIDPSTGNAIDEGKINTLIETKMEGLINQFKGIVQPLVDANNKTEAQTIEQYREKLIRENAGKVVPEMVVGNSVEELDKALVAGMAAFESVRRTFGVQTQEEILAEQRANNNTNPGQGAPQTWTNTPQPAQTQGQPTVNHVGNPVQVSNQPQQAAPQVQATPANLTPNFPTSPASNEVTDLPHRTAGQMSMTEFEKEREALKEGLERFANL